MLCGMTAPYCGPPPAYTTAPPTGREFPKRCQLQPLGAPVGPHLDTHQTMSMDNDVGMPAVPVTYGKHDKRSEECYCASLCDLVMVWHGFQPACRKCCAVYIYGCITASLCHRGADVFPGLPMTVPATRGAMEATASGCQFCAVRGYHCCMA